MSICNEMQAKLNERANALAGKLAEESQALAADIKKRTSEIDPRIDTSGPEVWVGVNFDVTWKRVDFSLDLPEVRLVEQRWALDLPQVTMKEQRLVFDIPSVRMTTVKTGEYPETTCRMVTKDVGLGVKIDVPECTVRWSPIYIDLPEPFMERQEIVLGIPEFRMERTEMILGIPEFTLKTHRFSLDLPEFKVKDIQVEASRARERGEALARDAKERSAKLRERFRAEAKVDLGGDVTALFDCYQNEMMQRKNEAASQFDSGINLLQGTLTAMVSNKVPEDNPNLAQIRNSLTELTAKRAAFAKDIEEKFVELGKRQKAFFDQLVGGM